MSRYVVLCHQLLFFGLPCSVSPRIVIIKQTQSFYSCTGFKVATSIQIIMQGIMQRILPLVAPQSLAIDRPMFVHLFDIFFSNFLFQFIRFVLIVVCVSDCLTKRGEFLIKPILIN
jgi:hypothetical protein